MAGNEKPPAIIHQPAALPALLIPPGALTAANNDDDLTSLWLRRPNLSAHTRRAGRREAERFMLWCRAHQLALRDIRYEHLLAYAEFIANPQPAADWIASGKWRQSDPRWRPFLGPLSKASQRQALVILQGLFRWAHSAQYLAANPAALLGSMSITVPREVERFLPISAMPYLHQAVTHMPDKRPSERLRKARARFVLMAYYLTAARLSELVTANMGSFQRSRHGHWWLHLIGKGVSSGKVPVTRQLLDELTTYRIAFGLSALPSPGDTTPLLLNSRGKKSRATSHPIAKSIKRIMATAASLAAAQGEADLAEQIARASTHWLRHSSLTHLVDAGADLKTVQLNARHAKLSTTGLYLHKEDHQRHAETIAAQSKITLQIPEK